MQMKWWKTFLRNRKQNDRVKLELAAVLLGLTGMILAMVHGVMLYQRLQTRMEYVLSPEGSVSQQNNRIAGIRELPAIEAVSRQVEGTITAGGAWGTMDLSYLQLSEEYLETVYGIPASHTAMAVYYLNPAAWQQLLRNAQVIDNTDSQMELTWQEESGEKVTILAKAADTDFGTDRPLAVTVGDSLALEKGQTGIRVCFGKRTIDNSQLLKLQNAGGTVINSEAVELEQNELEIQGIHIKYLGALALLCLCFAWALHRYGK